MFRSRFILLAAMFVLLVGMASAYTDLGGGWCACSDCGDCTDALNDDTLCVNGAISTGVPFGSGPTCIDNPTNFSNKVFDLNGTVIDGSAGGAFGIGLSDKENVTITNGTIQNYEFYGVHLENVSNATLYNLTISGVSGVLGAGIYLVAAGQDPTNHYVSASNISNCTVINNTNMGIWIHYAHQNEISNVVLLDNNNTGLFLFSSANNTVRYSIAEGSNDIATGGFGFACRSNAPVVNASGNLFEWVNASDNHIGIRLDACLDSTVRYSRFVSNNVGMQLNHSDRWENPPHNITALSNFISGNVLFGLAITDSSILANSSSRFIGNNIHNNLWGIYLQDSIVNSFENNSVNSTTFGITLERSNYASFEGDSVSNSTTSFYVYDSNYTYARNLHIFDSGPLQTFATSPIINLDINAIFDQSPLGNLENYTNLTIIDDMGASEGYTINWTTNSSSLPAGTLSFEQKWVDIFAAAGTPIIDTVIWHWNDDELPGYTESQFEIWKLSAGVWSQEAAGLDTSANTLTINNLDPLSRYGILQNLSACFVIDTPGTYQLNASLVGAPHAVTGIPVITNACIVIESSDVYLDLNGYTITNNGTATAAGIAINGSGTNIYSNITVVNGAGVSGYVRGFSSQDSTGLWIQNNTFADSSQYVATFLRIHHSNILDNVMTNSSSVAGVAFSSCSNNNISNNVAYGNSGYGFYITTSDYNNFTGNEAYENANTGFYITSSTHNNFMDNDAYDNGLHGFYALTNSNYNNFTGNEAYNNTRGFFFQNSNNNLLDSIARNNNVGVSLLNAYGLFENITTSENTDGFIVQQSIFTTGEIRNIVSANNTGTGFGVNSANVDVSGVHLYNNSGNALEIQDVVGAPMQFELTNFIFDNPLGNFINYTNLSITDTTDGSTFYYINWTSNSTTLPPGSFSFEQKWVEIGYLAGNDPIDEITWHWAAGEETGYTPAQFKLVEYDGADWNLMNDTPDTTARTLSLYDLDPSSDYGILQYLVNASVLKIDQTLIQASPGGIVEFNITINNTGNVTLDTVQVMDALPAGLQWAGGSPPPNFCTNGNCTWNNVGPLAPGATFTILINATVDDGVVGPGSEIVNLTNYVNVTGTTGMGEQVFAEDYANATVYYANVSAVKADITAIPPSPGGMVEYQITITNIGNVTLDPVSVVDTLPVVFTYNNSDPLPDDVSGATITWNNVGPIAPGATVTILMNATVNSGTANGTYTNTVEVEAQPPNGDNVTSTDTVEVGVYAPAVNVVKSASAYTATVGTKITFTLAITNTGESNLTIWANDTLPAQLAYVAGEADPLPTTVVGQSLYWDAIVADLTPGSTYNITYNATVLSAGSGITNNAVVTGVPPSGDNVTDTASVTLTTKKKPSSKPKDYLEVHVQEPICLNQPVTITVTSDGDPVQGAEVRIARGPPTYHYPLQITNSQGKITVVPLFEGHHRAQATKDGYLDDPSSFSVVSCPEAECYTNEDCAGLYDECYVCGSDGKCALKAAPEGMTPCSPTSYAPCAAIAIGPGPHPILACIDCVCTEVECIEDEHCPEGQQCIDYECVDKEKPPEEPPEEEVPCETNADCNYDQYCSDGVCTDLDCGESAYPQNHECVPYECMDDADCIELYGDNYFCNLEIHECEEIPEKPPDKPIDVDVPDETPVGQEVTITVTSGGDPVQGAEVTIVVNDIPYGAGFTNHNGQVVFIPEEPGQYTVVVSKEGFSSGEEEFTASETFDLWQTIIRGAWILLFLLILIGIIYVLVSRKKKERPKE